MKSTTPGLAIVLGTSLAFSSLVCATPAFGVTFSGTGSDVLADLTTTPNKIFRFDPQENFLEELELRWKMTSQFKSQFSLPKQQEQARLAVYEWEDAIANGVRRASPTYGWTRWGGASDFYDLRTILTHEIGHALGSNHPDAAWFNDSGDGTPYNQNYVPNGMGGWTPAPPQGGEIMNEGNDASSLPGSKPAPGLAPGAYWRTLSQDELDFLDHAYPQKINFVEVGSNEDADLIIDLFAVGAGPGSTLGIGGPDFHEAWDGGDVNQGRRITQASAKVREEASLPIGFKALSRNWEITNNTGESINSVIITARGTSNPIPTSWSSSGAKEFTFQGALAPPPVPDPDAFNLEDVSHLFTNAQNGPINNGESVEVGLRKDVWDWTVHESRAIQTDGDFVPIGLVGIVGFNITSPVVPSDDEVPSDITIGPGGLIALHGTFDILAKGFKLVNQEEIEVTISEIAFGLAPDLDPNRTDMLNADTLGRLSAGDVRTVPLATPMILAPGEDLCILLDGTPGALPPGANVIMVSPPEGFMQEQMFVYAATSGGGFNVGNYALLNTPVFVPEPSSLVLLLLGAAVMAGRRQKSVR